MPANHETIFCITDNTAPLPLFMGVVPLSAVFGIYKYQWQRLQATSLATSAIFSFVEYAVMLVFEETLYRCRFFRCFGGQVKGTMFYGKVFINSSRCTASIRTWQG